MDQKQKQAERELLELIKQCRATRRAFAKLTLLDRVWVAPSERDDLIAGINAVEEIEEAAWRAVEILRKPKD